MTQKTNEDINKQFNAIEHGANSAAQTGQAEDFEFLSNAVAIGEYPEASTEEMQKLTPSAKKNNG